MQARYLLDPRRRDSAHARGENYWYGYVAEVADQLGLALDALDPRTVRADPGRLLGLRLLIVGDLAEDDARALAGPLARWVQSGGVLLGFASPAPLDALFGVRPLGAPALSHDPFRPAATLTLPPHPLTHDLIPDGDGELALPVFSSVVRPVEASGDALGWLHAAAVDDPAPLAVLGAGICLRRLGQGHAAFFGFDPAQTMWTLHQGRPITADHDGDGYFRTGDMIVTGRYRPDVPYADVLLLLLQQLTALAGLPLLHQLPPWQDAVPDALFSWGGDDEAGTDGRQLAASGHFRSLGLPYHINCMAKPPEWRFGLAPEQARAILANGHELACHYNFHDGVRHPYRIQRDDVLFQHAAFVRTFGVPSLTSVNHWTHWTGWTEPAEWLLEAGQLADNSFVHKQSPPINPVNMLAFGFGGAFPYHLYRDGVGGNARLAFVEQPMNAYEPGYLGEETDLGLIRRAVDLAARYHLTLNMFYHPGYVQRLASCRAAIAELPRYCSERGLLAAHMGNDDLARWWHARSASRVVLIEAVGHALRLRVTAASPSGVVVKLPWDGARPQPMLGRQLLPCELRQTFGRPWLYVLVPGGEHEIGIEEESSP